MMKLKGTMVQDIVVLIGVIILVFITIYWALNFGVLVVSNIMHSSPEAIQDSVSSFLSVGCTYSGNFSVEFPVDKLKRVDIALQRDSSGWYNINFIPPGGKVYATEVERGGFVLLEQPPPDDFIGCDGVIIHTDTIRYSDAVNDKLVVVKEGNELGIEAR